MKGAKISDLLASAGAGAEVLVFGWVRTVRNSGSVSFLQVNDGSCLADIQIVVEGDALSLLDTTELSTGCSVRIDGTVVDSLGKGQKYEIQASSVQIIGHADPNDYPLQKKRHTLEFLRDIAHLRPRTNTFGAMSRVRNCLLYTSPSPRDGLLSRMPSSA